ncbi:thiamine-phosphate kinase [Methylobacterium sp. A54F]
MNGAARPSEDALIARYFAPLAGPGADSLRDDAAVLTPSPGHDLVLTADAIVAGVHYFPDDPPASVAVKALGVNLSDLAAKGARPRGFLLTLGLPDDWTEAWLSDFVDGLARTSASHRIPLLGGDTVRAAGPALIGVTAVGEVPTGTMVPRMAARPGDRILVSGTIGDAALGLRLRLAPGALWAGRLTDADRSHLLDRYLHPRPRLALAEVLRRHARAAMDVSDGFAGDLAKMLRGEGRGADVSLAQVPLSAAAEAVVAVDPGLREAALTGGDDYELLCCVPPEAAAVFASEAAASGVAVTDVGVVTTGDGVRFIDASNARASFARGSFRHF